MPCVEIMLSRECMLLISHNDPIFLRFIIFAFLFAPNFFVIHACASVKHQTHRCNNVIFARKHTVNTVYNVIRVGACNWSTRVSESNLKNTVDKWNG